MISRTLRLEPRARLSMMTHAERAHPEECCGFLVGDRLRAEPAASAAWPMENEGAPEERRGAYRISPEAYWRAESRARAEGAALLGVYHSHPDLPPRPSRADLDEAWPDLFYVVWETRDGRPLRMKAWCLSAGRSRFLPARIRTAGGRGEVKGDDRER